MESWPKSPFSQETWTDSKESERYVYCKNLISSQLLVGKERAEVESILGPASFERDWKAGPDLVYHRLIYTIMKGREHGVDDYSELFLMVNLKERKVSHVSIGGIE